MINKPKPAEASVNESKLQAIKKDMKEIKQDKIIQDKPK